MFFLKRFTKSPEIVLVISPPWDTMMPPLGIAYLESYLKEKGFHSIILDINIDLYNSVTKKERILWRPEMYPHWFEEEKFLQLKNSWEIYFERYTKKILFFKTSFIGFSVNTSNRLFSLELAKRIKLEDKRKTIIFGGPATFGLHLDTFFLRKKDDLPVDIFVIGEGEETLYEILLTQDIAKVKGAIFKKNGGYSLLIPRFPIMDINTIPFPTFESFPLNKYLIPALPLLISRGCVSRCSFCNDHRLSFPYRYKNPPYVIKEIEYHMKYNGINSFSFKDLLCNGNIPVLETLCNLIIEKKLNINWDSQAIPRKEMGFHLLEKMKRAGCHTLIYGLESASNRVLNKMKKMFTKEIAERVIRDTHRAGIRVYINIIVGFPGETEEDFMETYNFIKENRKYIDSLAALSVCLVNGETDLEFNPSKYGLLLPDEPEKRARFWKDIYGNDYHLRKERAERILSLLRELNLSYDSLNV
ncbi:MAG: radical SAM protein [Candidatus Omnitrophica bacterium]|nr:radical SAM protein [Candidatus Omnitrophota bacterium]